MDPLDVVVEQMTLFQSLADDAFRDRNGIAAVTWLDKAFDRAKIALKYTAAQPQRATCDVDPRVGNCKKISASSAK